MVTDNQVRRLLRLKQTEKSLTIAASKAGMDEKTARKYLRSGKLPSEVKPDHQWRTRKDPFIQVWEDLRSKLELNPGGQDTLRGPAAPIPGALPGWTAQNAAAQGETLARNQWAAQRSLLSPGASSGRTMPVRLYPPDEAERDD